VVFYSKFFKTEPTKIRPGYANFAIAEPPLKLVALRELRCAGSINHLGLKSFRRKKCKTPRSTSRTGLRDRHRGKDDVLLRVQDRCGSTDLILLVEVYTVLPTRTLYCVPPDRRARERSRATSGAARAVRLRRAVVTGHS